MEAGDVIMFNGLVWHSGLLNETDSCVVFMHFDQETFHVAEEMLRILDDPTVLRPKQIWLYQNAFRAAMAAV